MIMYLNILMLIFFVAFPAWGDDDHWCNDYAVEWREACHSATETSVTLPDSDTVASSEGESWAEKYEFKIDSGVIYYRPINCNSCMWDNSLSGALVHELINYRVEYSKYPTERVKKALEYALVSFDMHSVFLWSAVQNKEEKEAFKEIIERYQNRIKYIIEVYQEILTYEEAP